MNQLILGDNLEILRNWDSESVDLIYLDPPFFSNRTYEVIWGDRGEVRSFEDRWAGGVDHYIAWLKERVVEMHRILKPTGSIFLHCDWHANAYIRVYILDKLFGGNNFRNEIIWRRTTAGKPVFINLPNNSDSIFWYSKSSDCTFTAQTEELSEEDKKTFNKNDNDGRGFYNTQPIINPGIRPNLQYDYYDNSGKVWKSPKNGWRFNEQRMKELENDNRLVFGKTTIREKYYLNDRQEKGKQLSNVWIDIKIPSGKETIGYPTQKPEALLDRIIKMASNEGDVVMDPFLGGGTTIAVAEKLKRRWIGIDQSVQAVKVTELRLERDKDLFSSVFAVQLHKYDYDTLRYKDAFEFETWIVQQYGGVANAKRGGDMGMDGRTRDGRPIQVKRSDKIGRNVVDNFFSAVQRHDKRLYELNKAEGKPVGVIIAFSFGKGAVQEVARLKNEEGVLVELVTVESIVPIAKKPTIVLTFEDLGSDAKGNRTLRLRAEGSSEAGIEFYAWQWNHEPSMGFRPDVLIDREGTVTNSFAPGAYNLAVRAVDNEGLDATETLRLYINGGVKVRG